MDQHTTAPPAATTNTTTVAATPTTDVASATGGVVVEEAAAALRAENERRFAICRSVGCDCTTEEELRALLANPKVPLPRCYDGFEPSGRMHIAQGLYKALLVNKLTKCGCEFVFWVADYFALLNNKCGGNLQNIRRVGEYMIEVWRACGMDMSKVTFLWASDEINRRSGEYWELVMDIARRNTIKRILRCGTIMGRPTKARAAGEAADDDDEEAPSSSSTAPTFVDDQPVVTLNDIMSSQILYPCMQCADIFFLKADICQLGLDQRKVNMLAREYAELRKPKLKKPIILSHRMLMGLIEGMAKMSKSKPDSALFMEDTPEDIERKIMNGYCPARTVANNPMLDYMDAIIFGQDPTPTVLVREGEDGCGPERAFVSYKSLEEAYVRDEICPAGLRRALVRMLNELLEPVRRRFRDDPTAAAILRDVRGFAVTR
eukprot:gnl/Spiro4/17956_TR9574_c0_g1_i1.p1 gnl/Spiro4/17956_TR9574_c0_g1~~gnl/Spiro4/17956_TR9574_c0_g1_i1.p1  ORF type:complete len:433 (+),score=101.52 gnl/Spiro4/17956_TR9574_c0_g1_i1:65-1363(+)